jgi:nicotinate-nucleotide adenylyltransferase
MTRSFSWSKVTAVFGGRFDPPHRGHLEAMEGVLDAPGVRAVRVIPSAAPPHKPTVASAEHRLEMVQKLLHSSSRSDSLTADPRELERHRQTGRPSYTFETLGELRQLGIEPAFVLGTDAFAELDRWYRFPELLQAAHWIVLGRKQTPEAAAPATLQRFREAGLLRPASSVSLQGAPEWETSGPQPRRLILVPTPARPLSSTEIRETLARTGHPPKDSLPSEIEAYLSLHQLYGRAR